MNIGIPKETLDGESGVVVTPETAKKLRAQGYGLRAEGGAGVAAAMTDNLSARAC